MRALVAVAATAGFALVATPLAAAKAPSAVTGAATSVGATTAVVTGKVDPGGEAGAYLGRVLSHPSVREWEGAALQETAIIDADEPRILYRDRLAKRGVASA